MNNLGYPRKKPIYAALGGCGDSVGLYDGIPYLLDNKWKPECFLFKGEVSGYAKYSKMFSLSTIRFVPELDEGAGIFLNDGKMNRPHPTYTVDLNDKSRTFQFSLLDAVPLNDAPSIFPRINWGVYNIDSDSWLASFLYENSDGAIKSSMIEVKQDAPPRVVRHLVDTVDIVEDVLPSGDYIFKASGDSGNNLIELLRSRVRPLADKDRTMEYEPYECTTDPTPTPPPARYSSDQAIREKCLEFLTGDYDKWQELSLNRPLLVKDFPQDPVFFEYVIERVLYSETPPDYGVPWEPVLQQRYMDALDQISGTVTFQSANTCDDFPVYETITADVSELKKLYRNHYKGRWAKDYFRENPIQTYYIQDTPEYVAESTKDILQPFFGRYPPNSDNFEILLKPSDVFDKATSDSFGGITVEFSQSVTRDPLDGTIIIAPYRASLSSPKVSKYVYIGGDIVEVFSDAEIAGKKSTNVFCIGGNIGVAALSNTSVTTKVIKDYKGAREIVDVDPSLSDLSQSRFPLSTIMAYTRNLPDSAGTPCVCVVPNASNLEEYFIYTTEDCLVYTQLESEMIPDSYIKSLYEGTPPIP